jgi:hypothetical protein
MHTAWGRSTRSTIVGGVKIGQGLDKLIDAKLKSDLTTIAQEKTDGSNLAAQINAKLEANKGNKNKNR